MDSGAGPAVGTVLPDLPEDMIRHILSFLPDDDDLRTRYYLNHAWRRQANLQLKTLDLGRFAFRVLNMTNRQANQDQIYIPRLLLSLICYVRHHPNIERLNVPNLLFQLSYEYELSPVSLPYFMTEKVIDALSESVMPRLKVLVLHKALPNVDVPLKVFCDNNPTIKAVHLLNSHMNSLAWLPQGLEALILTQMKDDYESIDYIPPGLHQLSMSGPPRVLHEVLMQHPLTNIRTLELVATEPHPHRCQLLLQYLRDTFIPTNPRLERLRIVIRDMTDIGPERFPGIRILCINNSTNWPFTPVETLVPQSSVSVHYQYGA